MFRATLILRAANLRNGNQAARKAAAAMDQVRKKVHEARLAKEERQIASQDMITDKHVLEAYKELAEEERAQREGISVHALRHNEYRARGGREAGREAGRDFSFNRRGGKREEDDYEADGFNTRLL